MDRVGVQIPGTTLGATNSPPQHEVEHHGDNQQRVEGQDDDEQALGAGVHGWSKEQPRERERWWPQGLRATRKPPYLSEYPRSTVPLIDARVPAVTKAQQPPRMTCFVPLVGPVGFTSEDSE